MTQDDAHFTGFIGPRRIASGELVRVALRVKAAVEAGNRDAVTIIDDSTGDSVDLALHGTDAQVEARAQKRLAASRPRAVEEPARAPGPGRPKLGVVSREVSLLPRHWEWLAEQPGGASAALRRLVEQARRDNAGADRARKARDAAYRFLHVMGGDLPGFEEASRALFAQDLPKLDAILDAWPKDLRTHARQLIQTWRELADAADRPSV